MDRRWLALVLLLASACGRIGFDELGGGDDEPPLPEVSVAAGGRTSCVIDRGTVSCWGDNRDGQLGDGTHISRSVPVEIPLLQGSRAIAVNARHACALRPDGDVWCWGQNDHEALGVPGGPRAEPDDVVDLPARVLQVAVGHYHTCARLEGGDVWCWGKNTAGQLGTGVAQSGGVETPQRVLIDDVVEIATGGWFSCARRSRGDVWCWGENVHGQLGRGTETGGEGTPAPIAGLVASSISIGDNHACAIEAGRYRCWGHGGNGKTGFNDQGPMPLPPSTLSGLIAIRASESHTCATTDDGRVFCFGGGLLGEHGDGTRESDTEPHEVAAADLTQVAVGDGHACAVKSGDQIVCWGRGSHGQLGDGRDLGLNPERIAFPAGTNIDAVGTGSGFACAKSASQIWCWGDNRSAQLGNGDRGSSSQPIAVPVTLGTLAGLAVGTEHACAWDTAGAAQCWGANGSGQLGDGTTTGSTSPVSVGITVSMISLGYAFSCALDTSNNVQCWGANDTGQLGDVAAGDHRTTPAIVPGMINLTEVRAGTYHACARDTGTTCCWGRNGDGQLGVGDDVNRPSPTTLSTAPSFIALAPGGGHTCARGADNELYCWGSANYGVPDLRAEPAPTLVPGFTGSQFAAGGSSTCAIDGAGGASCWGGNGFGQTGDGTFLGHDASPVVGLPPITQIAINDDLACALSVAGDVWCWGNNEVGQLGRGIQTSAGKPVTAYAP